MNDGKRPTALVSGCSTGIGHHVARRFAERGIRVVAGARNPASLEDLASKHPDLLYPIPWDVTDPEATRAAVTRTIERFGSLEILVNNAGYGQMGPLVELTREEWRRQLETNVVGLADAAAAAARAPGGMIERRRGRIVNVGSIAGRITIPMGGAYCASKYAVEAISDTLRMELAPFGIEVVLVEPGPVRSSFGLNARRTIERMLATKGSPYEYMREVLEERTSISQQNTTPTEGCAEVIVRVATMRRPPARVLVTPHARLALWAKRLLPGRVLDGLMRKRFGLEGSAPPDRDSVRPRTNLQR